MKKPEPAALPPIGLEHPGRRLCHTCWEAYIKAAVDGYELCPKCLPYVQARAIKERRRKKLLARDKNQCKSAERTADHDGSEVHEGDNGMRSRADVVPQV